MVSLHDIKQRRAHHQQHSGAGQHQLAVEPVAAEIQAVDQHVIPHQKPNAPRYDQCHDHQIQKGLTGLRGQRGAGTQQVKARVAEGRHRMEYRHPKSPPHAVPGTEPKGQQHRAAALAGAVTARARRVSRTTPPT